MADYKDAPAAIIRITRALPSEEGVMYRCEVVDESGQTLARIPSVTGWRLDDTAAGKGAPGRGSVDLLGLEVRYMPNFARGIR